MMGIFKRGGDDKGGQWSGNGASGHTPPPPPMTTAQELRMGRSPPSAPQGAHPGEGEALSYNLGTLMERVSLSSVQEIDRLIAELQSLKVGLQHEAERAQGEVGGFAS